MVLASSFQYFLNIISSQVQPSPTNLAANMLSDEARNRNLQKVKINAQIMFVIYVLECVANTSIYIVWAFVTGTSNQVTLGLALLWFHILLPYTFLMNTSHNKNRLIDEGWLNTIRNTIVHPKGLNINSKISLPKMSLTSFQRESRVHPESISSSKASNDHSTHLFRRTTDRSQIETNANNTGTIFIISNAKLLQPCSSTTSKIVPDEHLQGNGRQKSIETLTTSPRLPSRLNSQPSESDEENQLPPRSPYLSLGESLFSYLEQYLNNEEGYLHYLHQIAKLDKINQEDKISLTTFEILHFSNLSRPKIGKIKRSTKYPRHKLSPEMKDNSSFSSKNSPHRSVRHDDMMYGNFMDRTETRKSLLNDFQDHCNNEKDFKTFCNLIIDFEESLIRH